MCRSLSRPGLPGPFDLLLHLILQDQVDLYEVRLTDIVDAYLGHLPRMESMDLELATEFLLIAATLIELKSKRLLPDEGDIDLDDELALWEERDLLLSRLVECKTFKDAAVAMAAIANEAGRSFPRTAGVEERFLGLLPDLLEHTTADDLRGAFLRAVAPKPVPRVDIGHIHQIRVTVTDAVAELLDELPRHRPRHVRRPHRRPRSTASRSSSASSPCSSCSSRGGSTSSSPHTLGGAHRGLARRAATVDADDLAFVDAYDG